jgi:3-oxosteroid 1-dehydrogenase
MITSRPTEWDSVVDVIVVGSGAAGLVAATMAHDGGAKVVVVEKAPLIGGTTAWSGGVPWIPMNHHMQDLGQTDSREEALTYVRRVTLGREPDPDLVETYVDRAAEMLEYLEAKTPLRMTAVPAFNDYYAHFPGGKNGGRSLESMPFEARAELGDEAARLRTSPHLPWLRLEEGGKMMRGEELPADDDDGEGGEGERVAAFAPGRTAYAIFGMAAKREAQDIRVIGAAVVASLYKGLMDRGVEVITGTRARELVMVDDVVVGLHVERDGAREVIGARKGVVLACGGFEWNQSMVKAFIGMPISPVSPPYNEGDGLQMAMEAGAELANMTSFWGMPAIVEPGFERDGRSIAQMGTARGMRGAIVINQQGRRFVNEGATYMDFPKSQRTYDPVAVEYPNEAPHWIVFDQTVKDGSVILPSVVPGQDAPEWVAQSSTIRGLAAAIDVDPGVLEQTVERWNASVAAGEDADHHRGTTYYEALGFGKAPSPSDFLGTIAEPPFYAVPMVNGALGTNGGPRIDGEGRVRRQGGGVIPGLYAAGNTSASVFGQAYPGGGSTIGPAMTFGYLAGRHVAAEPGRDV